MPPEVHQQVKKFNSLRVLVVGDVMLDEYILGAPLRLSEEAAAPVIKEEEHRYLLGGAANVANNLAALGAEVYLAGVIGNDREGDLLKRACRESRLDTRHLIKDSERPTTVKKRILGHGRHFLRLDQESTSPLGPKIEQALLKSIKSIKKVDLVIFSDYAKGVLSAKFVDSIRKFFKTITIADFKPSQASLYRGRVDVILPNVKEAYGITGREAKDDLSAVYVAKHLSRTFSSSVVLKRSAAGMSIFDKENKKVIHIPTEAREVFDVTGAGDTVIAAVGLGLASGMSLIEAARVGNHAAGIVVELEGTAVATQEKLLERLRALEG